MYLACAFAPGKLRHLPNITGPSSRQKEDAGQHLSDVCFYVKVGILLVVKSSRITSSGGSAFGSRLVVLPE
jgi:hypothetical protein